MSDDILSIYETYLKEKEVSAHAMKVYRHVLRSLFEFVHLNPNEVAQVTAAQLRSYVVHLLEQNLLSESSILSHVGAIKVFFRIMHEEGYVQQNPAANLPRPRIPHRLPRTLTPEQIRNLMERIRHSQSKRARRNYVVFYLCYTCGMRLSEVVRLRGEYIDLHEGKMRIVAQDGDERSIFLKETTVELLASYIRENAIEGFLFPGRTQGHIGIAGLEGQFREYVRAAGLLQWVTVTTLRHSIAVHLLAAGVPISFVQHLLGHESLETTMIYANLADPNTKAIALQTPTAIDRTVD